MAQGKPVDPATRARVISLIRAGRTRNAVAAEVGMSGFTVSKIASEEGLLFDRAATAAATAARVIDLRARRAALVTRGYARAEALYARLEATEFRTLMKGPGGAESSETLDFVPTPNERDLASAISVHLSAVAKLELQDADSGQSDAKSLLTELGKALGVRRPDET